MRRLKALVLGLALTLPRTLCRFGFHTWQTVVLEGRPHVAARACTRCPAKQRKLGTSWMPCSSKWGWLPEDKAP